MSDLVRVRVRVKVRAGARARIRVRARARARARVRVRVRVGVPWSCRTRAAGAAMRASEARRSIGALAATWAWATDAPG